MPDLTEWMYCFSCGSVHLFSQQADGRWRCTYCKASRVLIASDPPDEPAPLALPAESEAQG